jgi:hypothetical protein
MKKILYTAVAIFCSLIITDLKAQASANITQGTPEEFLQMLRERQKPVLISKLKLTDEQAEKIIVVQVWAAPYLRKIAFETPEDQKKGEVKLLNDEKEKKYKSILVNDEQVKKVIEFYADMLKNRTWPDGEKQSAVIHK